MIQVENLTKTINNQMILEDISIDIEKGKLTSLIGPTNAVDTETKTETITSRIRVNFSYDIPRLIASTRPKSNTSK